MHLQKFRILSVNRLRPNSEHGCSLETRMCRRAFPTARIGKMLYYGMNMDHLLIKYCAVFSSRGLYHVTPGLRHRFAPWLSSICVFPVSPHSLIVLLIGKHHGRASPCSTHSSQEPSCCWTPG